MLTIDVPRPSRRFKVQWRPNYIREERRLVLMRIYWNRGTPGDGKGHSNKLSISLSWSFRWFLVGVRTKPELWGWIAWIFLVPCLAIRIHKKRAYGGSFI